MICTSDIIELLLKSYRSERKTREKTLFLKILSNTGADNGKPCEKIVLVKVWNPLKPFLLKNK